MTTPQDSPRRKKQKIRRANQLAKWREKQEAQGGAGKAPAKRAAKPAAAKKAEKPAEAAKKAEKPAAAAKR